MAPMRYFSGGSYYEFPVINLPQYDGVTLASWRLKLLATRLFIEQFT